MAVVGLHCHCLLAGALAFAVVLCFGFCPAAHASGVLAFNLNLVVFGPAHGDMRVLWVRLGGGGFIFRMCELSFFLSVLATQQLSTMLRAVDHKMSNHD